MKFSPIASALALTLGAAALALASAQALASATVGQPAPAFTATDTQGKTVSLADFKGKHVVLEWVNPKCPFVVKHYDTGNLPGTQKEARDQGVVWLAINSTSKASGEFLEPADLQAWMASHKAAATHTLMDEPGTIGRSYGARTTPHMYIINPAGTLVYAGAIDSIPSANRADIARATNHVREALAESLAGKPVSVATTRAYGCTVKYAPAA
jgi:peroxiredoxin